jgi:hypothetical protein
MSRKLLIMLVVIATGAFMASSAIAQVYWGLGEVAQIGIPVDNQTAGTILNPEGKGDVLLFPYYDVRELNLKPQDTYFAIINERYLATPGGVAAKLRFREWDKSEEVYDIEIWLSCDDVWVGLINQDPEKQLARLWSPDYVITSVSTDNLKFIVSNPLDVRDPVTEALLGREFRASVIGLPNERTLYGYFEVIGEEMTDCKPVDGAVTRLFEDCPNTLAGFAYIVRVADGVAMAYNATAIANFARNFGSLFTGPGATKPDLTDAEDTIDQVEFVLSKAFISQNYSIEPSIAAQFSAIITFPTKHFHFAEDPPYSLNSNTITYFIGQRPRGEPFEGDTSNSGEEISLIIWDRDENPFLPPPGFESPPVETEELRLPYEVNIVGLYIGQGAPTLTNPRDNVGFPTGTFESGWFLMDFPHAKLLDDEGGGSFGGNVVISLLYFYGFTFQAYAGLPVIGMVAQEFANSTVGVGAAFGEFLPVYYDVFWATTAVGAVALGR